jgi:hypothetical protein
MYVSLYYYTRILLLMCHHTTVYASQASWRTRWGWARLHKP